MAATSAIAKLLKEEEFGGQFHEGTKYNVNISVVAKRAILAVLFDSNSSIGLVRLRVRRSSEEMTKVFDDLVHKIQQQQKGGGGGHGPNLAGEITDDDIDKLVWRVTRAPQWVPSADLRVL